MHDGRIDCGSKGSKRHIAKGTTHFVQMRPWERDIFEACSQTVNSIGSDNSFGMGEVEEEGKTWKKEKSEDQPSINVYRR